MSNWTRCELYSPNLSDLWEPHKDCTSQSISTHCSVEDEGH